MPDSTETVVVKKIFNEDLLPHALEVIRQDRVLKPGEVKGDNIADATITMAKMLGMIVGGGSSTGELEDLAIRTGRFTNAGSGWNTFSFPEPFDGVPQVFAEAEGEYDVSVMSVTETGFLYRVSAGATGTLDLTKSSYYVHTQKSTSATYMVQASLVTDAELATSGGATADEASIMWVAVEFGGE